MASSLRREDARSRPRYPPAVLARQLSLFVVGLALCSWGGGCATQPTQLLVRVDTDMATDVEPRVAGDGVLRAVRVDICEQSCDRPGTARDRRFWSVSRTSSEGRVRVPFSFGVAPRDLESPGQVELLIDALEVADEGAGAAEILFTARRTIAFVPGRKVEVPIFLSAGCLGASCPPGTTCDDEGQCAPLGSVDAGSLDAGEPDAGLDAAVPGIDAHLAIDAGLDAPGFADAPSSEDASRADVLSIDAALADAGRDAGPVDASHDVGRDAILFDGGPPDAARFDASRPDAGPETCAPATAPFPGAWTATRHTGFSGGWVRTVGVGPTGAVLSTGTFLSSGTFTWEGSSSPAAHFVSRRSTGGTWTTFAVFDRALYSSLGSYGQVTQVIERGGVVYVAGTAIEGWSITAAGATIAVPEMPSAPTTSARVGIVVLALDAATGRPLWARTIDTRDSSDFADGIAADDDGVWVAFRSFAPSAGLEIGELLVDGAPRVIDRGPALGHARLARLDRASGAVSSVHAFGGIGANALDVDALPGGDVIVSLNVSYLDGYTSIDGIWPVPPSGEIVLTRIDPTGASRWSTALQCSVGSWRSRSGQIAVADGRVHLGFGATTSSGDTACATLRATVSDGTSVTASRLDTGPTWLGVAPFDVCDGHWLGGSLFSASVNGTPGATLTDISADARAVAITGHVGVGGLDLGGGRTIAGREAGAMADGTDGYAIVLTPAAELRFQRMLGSTTGSILTGADDYGTSIAIGPDVLVLGLGLTAPQTLDAVTVQSGARLVDFSLR